MKKNLDVTNNRVVYCYLTLVFVSHLQEAVKKVFERARQYCDPKKVYLALLGVYERTEQYKLADKLLDEMIKKFKQSCKVHAVISLSSQTKDWLVTLLTICI